MTAPTVGIIGSGQLARMTAQAAISLAVDTKVLAIDRTDPSCSAASTVELGDPNDLDVMTRFSSGCDVVTFDHERVDPSLIAMLEARGHNVQPTSEALRFADKAHQRSVLSAMGFPVPAFGLVSTLEEIDSFATEHAWPLVIKSAVGGYDGKGVFVVQDLAHARHELPALGRLRAVVEPMLDIETEVAVLVVRRPSGDALAYPLVETVQVGAICVETVAPAAIDPKRASEAATLALAIAEAVGATGMLAVELFITGQGIVVNELAPRPHNSGHWTIEGASTSQFENHLRGILDWPLGVTSLTAPAVATVNVLGGMSHTDPSGRLPAALAVEGAHIHLYGKAHRPGRKLGHVTATGPTRAGALDRARRAAFALTHEPSPTTSTGVST